MDVIRRPAEIAACRFRGMSTFGMPFSSFEEAGIGRDARAHGLAFLSSDMVRGANAAAVFASAISRRPAAKTDVGRID